MKKILLPITIILFLFIINTISAQKLYIKPVFGYSFGVHKTFLSVYNVKTDMSIDTTISRESWDLKKTSFGKGINAELAVGTYLNKKFAIELIGFYHKSGEIEFENNENITVSEVFNVRINEKNTIEGFMYGIKPNLVYVLHKGKMSFYVKTGAMLAMLSMKEKGEMQIFNNIPGYRPTEFSSYEAEYKKRLSLGFNISSGTEFYLINNIKGFIELNYENIRYIPLERELVKYEYENKNELNTFNTNEIFTEYVDSYSDVNNTDNSPTKILKSSYSFSNIGILCGIRINILN